MNWLRAQAQPPPLTEGQRMALITLLGDDDPAVHEVVRARLLACGPEAARWLQPHTLSANTVLRRHAREIIRRLAQQTADERFLAFCLQQGEHLDLEQGAWLLAQTEYPDINCEAYQALLDAWADVIRHRLPPVRTGRRTLTIVWQFLFRELGFRGHAPDDRAPDQYYLNRILDERRGSSLGLTLLLLLVARRLRLPLVGVALPGRFLCRYQSVAATELYLDVLDEARIMTRAECLQFWQEALGVALPLRPEKCLRPVTPRRLLFHLCQHLRRSYALQKHAENFNRLQRYVVALTN